MRRIGTGTLPYEKNFAYPAVSANPDPNLLWADLRKSAAVRIW